ncbi:TPA: flagellar biosynthesis anti-sigma factor FlgM [Candidatus Poribacteria bacterium]|nr:flagellar biosynthesis anti-sigma factor FlgM [Candidatus Poribacteria bacterium]HEX29204.1 flagellar biosynthesis anti-sigma factor FlgM [Candidatus Poribacteria bacterium]
MKIVNGNILNIYMRRTRPVNQEEVAGQTQRSPSDRKTDVVELSPAVKEVDRAKEMAQTMPEERAEKVEQIRNQIENGLYRIQPEKIAQKMIEHAIDILA